MRSLAKFASVGLVLTAFISMASPAHAQDSSAASDTYIVQQASALGNDPNQIFAFVRDQIHNQVYYGSVRGARGTLWSKAGNTLDKASLLVALLGAAGIPAQYEHTSLADPSSLILSMFPNPTQLLGCIPTTDFVDTPAFNGPVRSDAFSYYWVQYGAGIQLDPNQPAWLPGTTPPFPPDSSSGFTTVPDNLRQKVTVKLNAELYSQSSGLFGQGPGTTTVLTQTFNASDLIGHPLSVGTLVQSTGAGALDITATTFTYTPYILVGSGGPDVKQDHIIVGTNFQELFTNFPLGSSVLTGLFLEIDAEDITYTQHAYTRTIFDRLGPAARQGTASVQLNLPATPKPALTSFDIATVNILTSNQLVTAFQAQQTRLTNAYNNYLAIKPALASVPTTGPLTAAQQSIAQQGATLAQYLLIAENELIAMSYAGAA
ncbi:MAG TPA: transglutaminase family protein, partial [Vicinamibacterales bacterium]|nr:transglutaminase family protein [Vicinamibacterales bacterium]